MSKFLPPDWLDPPLPPTIILTLPPTRTNCYMYGITQARIQDFFDRGWNPNFSQMFDSTGNSNHSRTRSVRDSEVGGSGVARLSASQRGPGRSPGNQRILDYPYSQKYIKKISFNQNFTKNFTLELVKSVENFKSMNQQQLATSVKQ